MKYKASFTKGIYLAIIIIILYLVITVMLGSNSVSDLIQISVPVIIFGIVYILALTMGTHIVIENNSVKNYLMFLPKGTAEINTIKKIQSGSIGGIFKALILAYEENGKAKAMNISILNLKKNTLKQFVSDLRKQNPQISIDQSVNELTS